MQRIDGRYLQELRKEHGYSIRALADLIYVSKSTVSRWEASSVPEDENTLARIAEVFGTTVEDMRAQSALKYEGEGGGKAPVPDDEDDMLSADQRAGVRFGIKGLAICCGVIFAAAIILVILALLTR
ncbi:MAG: helix-turn-helix domain-containing protein [Clostridia bacterium]|nr:helix-turn-helix domain-containing protein [Clostridia bacterium]